MTHRQRVETGMSESAEERRARRLARRRERDEEEAAAPTKDRTRESLSYGGSRMKVPSLDDIEQDDDGQSEY